MRDDAGSVIEPGIQMADTHTSLKDFPKIVVAPRKEGIAHIVAATADGHPGFDQLMNPGQSAPLGRKGLPRFVSFSTLQIQIT